MTRGPTTSIGIDFVGVHFEYREVWISSNMGVKNNLWKNSQNNYTYAEIFEVIIGTFLKS